MPVMSTGISVMIGLAAAWTKAKSDYKYWMNSRNRAGDRDQSRDPGASIFIAFTFCALSYEGTITKQLPVFIKSRTDRYGRALYLAGCALCGRRRLFEEQPAGCHQELWPGIYYGRNDVFCSNAGGCLRCAKNRNRLSERIWLILGFRCLQISISAVRY